MPKAISSDLRWRVVWLYIWDGWDERDIGKTLRLSRDTVKRTLERFFNTGDVVTFQGQRHAPPHNQQLMPIHELELMDLIIDHPEFTLKEHRNAWEASSGVSVHISTICRWIQRVGGSRQQVCRSLVSPRPSFARARTECLLNGSSSSAWHLREAA